MEKHGDLAAANVVLRSQARDTDLWRAVAKDKLEGHQMICAEAGRGELGTAGGSSSWRVRAAQETITALSARSIDDPGGKR